jgi:ABC-type branched-subunit amino acid transport system ATPase component
MRGLELSAVARDYAGVHAVRGVSLHVAPGEVVGLMGPNGSGKTTLVNVVSGAIAPSSGTVTVDGVDLTGAPSTRFSAAGVVRTFQGLRLFEGLTVLDNVLVGAQRTVHPSLAWAVVRPPRFRRQEARLHATATAALEMVRMAEFAGRPVGALSHGQRRRVELARAFAAGPRYLVLDEPGAGIDPDHLDDLAAIVARHRDEGVGMLVVEHDPALVERIAGRVLGMADGALVAEGSFAEVTAHPDLAAQLGAAG